MRRSQDSVGQASNEPVDRRTAKYEEKRHVAACQNRGRCPTKEHKFITIWGVAHVPLDSDLEACGRHENHQNGMDHSP
jgi:hypothetical protein